MRICAVSLPELRVEIVRAPNTEGPLAIVVAPPPLDETKLLGNTRLDVVSREARSFGVRPGQTIAQARARVGGSLAVRVVPPTAVRSALARLAEIVLCFGATVSFGMDTGEDDSFGDVVWVDVTGCAHLFARGGSQDQGEALLAARLAGVIASLGHACSVAIADGPRVAAIFARAAFDAGPHVVVVPPGENARALETLSVASLPIAKEHVRWLSKIGVRTIAEMRALPRAGLLSRLETNDTQRARDILALLDGEDRAPLVAYRPPEVPEEEATFEYAVESVSALTFVAKTLCDRLAARLTGRASSATRIELELKLDAAMLEEGAPFTHLVALDLPAPLASASDLLAALRTKLERVLLRAPVLAAKLRAFGLVHKREVLLSLYEPEPVAERTLPRLVAMLAADLGGDAVGKLALGDAWSLEERSQFVRLDSKCLDKPSSRLLTSVPEPTRLLAKPLPLVRARVRVVRHLLRLEGTSWWKSLPGSPHQGAVDHLLGWTCDGAALVSIDRKTGAARVHGWFD
jgi:protein ImuB